MWVIKFLNMSVTSVVPLISLWEGFLSSHPNGNVQAFAQWILTKGNRNSTPAVKRKKLSSTASAKSGQMTDESKAMLLLYRLNKFIDLRSKPKIKEIGFAKPQEFAMLAEIYLLQKPNKKELAKQMLLEFSTAVEISKRLVQRGLVKEVWDPNDKRATLLAITEKGMKKLYESYKSLQDVHINFLGCFNDREKTELLKLLVQLEIFQSALTENDNMAAAKTARTPA